MKKFLFLGLAAMMAFTSCTKDETLATAQNGAIGFDVAADKATRAYDPSITTQNITDFAVYGFMTDVNGVVFYDEEVTNNSGAWTYTNTQYWVAGKNYYFAALAPSVDRAWSLDTTGASTFGAGTVTFTNEGAQDLLYWAQGPIVGQANNNPVVGITFKHLLSKVKFTFANQFDNENAYIVVRDIKINNHPSVAKINLAVDKWWENKKAWEYTGETTTYAFGNADTAAVDGQAKIAQYASAPSFNEVLLFPYENQAFDITYVVDLYMGEALAQTYEHKVPLTTTLEMGYAYNFKASFNAKNITGKDDETLEPIKFTVEKVEDWMQPGEDVALNYELIDTDEVLENKTLTSDVVVSGSATIAGTFDGGNFTATPSNPAEKGGVYPFLILTPGTTVQNVTIDGQNAEAVKDGVTYGIRNIFINKPGTYTINNVKSYNATYPIHVNTNTEEVILNVSNSTLQGWTSYGTTTTATFNNVTFVKGAKYGNFKPYGTTTVTNCEFTNVNLDFSALAENIVFDGCTVNGVALTEANIASVSEAYEAKKALITIQ